MSRFQPSGQHLGALAGYGDARDDQLAARKKVFKAIGAQSYSQVSEAQRGLEVELSDRNRALRLVGNILYTIQKATFTGASDAKIVESVDSVMYPYYSGSQSVTDILKFGRNELKRSGSTPSVNARRDKFVELITDLISEAPSGGAAVPVTALDAKLLNGTWNDGTYTYKIDNNGVVLAGGKKFSPGDAKYAAVAGTLTVDLKSGRLKSGSAPSRPKQDYKPPEKPPEEKIVETKLTDKVWFWPAVALVGVGGLTTGVIVWKRRRASAS